MNHKAEGTIVQLSFDPAPSYLDFLQKVEKLRNENHLRCSTYVFVFRSFVLFVYEITK